MRIGIDKWVIAAVLALSPAWVLAETQYITDELAVPLRRGPGGNYKIINAGLPSGTSLEIVAKDDGSGFTQVRTPNGTEGYVPTQYLTSEPIARDRLAAAQKRLESVTAELATLRQNLKAEQGARNSAESSSSDLAKQLKQTQAELSEIKRVSANSVAMYQENQTLTEQSKKLQQKVGELDVQVKSLKANEVEIWILTGAGLVVLGLVFGIAIKSRPKRRDGW